MKLPRVKPIIIALAIVAAAAALFVGGVLPMAAFGGIRLEASARFYADLNQTSVMVYLYDPHFPVGRGTVREQLEHVSVKMTLHLATGELVLEWSGGEPFARVSGPNESQRVLMSAIASYVSVKKAILLTITLSGRHSPLTLGIEASCAGGAWARETITLVAEEVEAR